MNIFHQTMRLPWLIISIVAITVIVWIAKLRPEAGFSEWIADEGPHSPGVKERQGSEDATPLARHSSAPNPPSSNRSGTRGLGTAPAVLMPGMVRLSPEVIKSVLKDKENIPLTAAALLWTRDEALWESARKRMSGQPLLAATIAFSGRNDEERLDAAKCLMALEPENPLGYVAALDISSRIGDASQIDALLSSMPPGESLNPFAMDFHSGLREVFTLAEYNQVEKGLLLSQDPWQLKIVDKIASLTQLCSGEISTEDNAERASIILNLIDGYRDSGAGNLPATVLTQLSRAEELTLRRLPGDYRLLNGSTVAQEASKLSTRRIEEIEKQTRISDALSTMDYEAVSDYYQLLDSEGDAEATKWLIGE